MYATNMIAPQHLLLLARYTHQSMPIVITLLVELRVSMPTAGVIKVDWHQQVYSQSNIFSVMVPNVN